MHKCYKKYDWKNKNYPLRSWNYYAQMVCDNVILSASLGRSYKNCLYDLSDFYTYDCKIIGERAAKRFGRLRRQGKVKFNPPSNPYIDI